MSARSSARDLDRAIDRILAGDEAVEFGDGQVLATARRLAALNKPAAEPPARALARDLFLAEADARRARWVHSHHVPAVAPPPPKKGLRLGQLSALIGALLIAVLLGGILAAVASFSTPDSPFYGVKRSGESVLLRVSFDPIRRSDLDVNLAEERLRESEGMAVAGKPDIALDTLSSRYAELRDAGDRLAAVRNHDARWKGAVSRYLSEAQKPATPLQHQLSQKGYPSYADQAGRMASDFQKYLDGIKPQLGATTPGPTPTPLPTPLPTS